MKRLLVGILCGMLAIGTFAGCGSTKENAKQETSTFTWPTNELGKAIPVADFGDGEIECQTESILIINLNNVEEDDFNSYVKQCADAGYTIDALQFDNYYYAMSEDGYAVNIDYDKDKKTLRIQVTPHKSNDSTDTSSTETESSAPAEETTDQSTDQSADSNGIRPEVKEFLDSYESFMNEYADFMEKYNESDDVASMMKDYTTYMTKYADFTQKYEDLGDDDLNDEELKYYVDVQSRVTKRLIDVAN